MLSTIVAIAVLVSIGIQVGVTGWQGALSGLNANLKSTVNKLVSTINEGIKSKRLSVNKLLSLLSSKNQAALSGYLLNNPAVSKTLADINADAALIADLSASQSALETTIAALQNELSSLGYAQSHSGAAKEKEQYAETKRKLEGAQAEYSELEEKVKGTNLSANKSITPDTSHLDAISQNLEGGYNPHGL